MDFKTAMKDRRTYYQIDNKISISDARIESIITESVLYTPSAFNSQNARVVLLFGEHHKKLWNITKDLLKEVTPPKAFPQTEAKINSFARGYGTILYFEDKSVVEELQEKYPLYKAHFPIWSQQANGMLQYVIWTTLESEGLGASLQHYNPLIDEAVQKEWDIPDTWVLCSQMPFGNPTAKPDEKTFLPIETRVKIFK